MIKGCTFENQNVTSKNDGGLYSAILRDGILWGCSMSATSTALTIQPGEMIIGGRVIYVDGATSIAAEDPISNGYGQLVLSIDLTKTATGGAFEQLEIGFVYSTTETFPELTKEDINSMGTLYEAELAVVKIEGGNITGITSKIPATRADALGLGQVIPQSADLNTYTTPGIYRSESASISGTLSNCPFTNGGFKLIVENTGTEDMLCQIVHGNYNPPKMYVRIRSTASGSWSAWREIITSAGGTVDELHFPNGYAYINDYGQIVGETGSGSFGVYQTSDGQALLYINLTNGSTQICATNGTSWVPLHWFAETSGESRHILRTNPGNVGYLGTAGYRWNTLFLTNTPNVSSDRKYKTNIGYIEKAKEFIMGLKPVEFTRTEAGSNGIRKHMGFIAQEVAELAGELEMGDLSVYEASKVEADGEESAYTEGTPDEQLVWGLHYEEFIAPMVAALQTQQAEIAELKEKIEEMTKDA